MKELLNKLIEKGWKPRGENAVPNSYWVEGNSICWNRGGKASIRELVSKESGLWQFVCENKMTIVKHPNEGKYPRDKLEREEYREWNKTQGYYGEFDRDTDGYNWDKAEYWIIESALCDEDKLEQFLLDNIKIDESKRIN